MSLFLAKETRRGTVSEKPIKTLKGQKGLKAWRGDDVGCRGKKWLWGGGENPRAGLRPQERQAQTPTWLPRGAVPSPVSCCGQERQGGKAASRQGNMSFSPRERHGPGQGRASPSLSFLICKIGPAAEWTLRPCGEGETPSHVQHPSQGVVGPCCSPGSRLEKHPSAPGQKKTPTTSVLRTSCPDQNCRPGSSEPLQGTWNKSNQSLSPV